jgi:hypothetical protein
MCYPHDDLLDGMVCSGWLRYSGAFHQGSVLPACCAYCWSEVLLLLLPQVAAGGC